MSRQRTLIFLLGIILLGVLLRSWEITARSIWFDEAFTWRLIQFPAAELIVRDAADVHPPLYYLILKFWGVVFGTSLLSIRMFSVMVAGAAIGAMYLFVQEIFRSSDKREMDIARNRGLIAALFLAVAGWQIAFAWEARMYTLGTFFLLFGSWLLLKALSQKTSRLGWWITYGLVVAACAYTHYYAFFSLAAQGIFVAGMILFQSRGRIGEMFFSRHTWHAVLAFGLGALLFAPWIPTLLRQNAQVQNAFWIPTIIRWTIPDTLYRMVAPTSETPLHEWPGMLLTLAPIILTVLGGLLLLAIGRSRSVRHLKSESGIWLIIVSALFPFIFSITVSLIGQSLYNDRFFVFSHIFLIAGTAVLMSFIPSTWLRRSAVTIITLGSIVLFMQYWSELRIKEKPGAQAAVRYAYTNRADNEPVYATSSFIFFSLLHYAQEEFAANPAPQYISDTKEVIHFAGGPIFTDNDIVAVPEVTASSTQALWLIETSGFGGQKLALPSPWQKVEEHAYPEVFGHQGEVSVSKYTR